MRYTFVKQHDATDCAAACMAYETFTGALLLLKLTVFFEREKIKGEKLFGRYITFLLPQKKLFFYAIIASCIMTAMGIVSSLFSNIIYDEILPYHQKDVFRIIFVSKGYNIYNGC